MHLLRLGGENEKNIRPGEKMTKKRKSGKIEESARHSLLLSRGHLLYRGATGPWRGERGEGAGALFVDPALRAV